MKWWDESPLGWEKTLHGLDKPSWWEMNWIMWANGCIKQTNIWLNYKINTGQSPLKDPAILPLTASAIRHVWNKTRKSLLSWAKTISEKWKCNCISAERDSGSFIMLAQLNRHLKEKKKMKMRSGSEAIVHAKLMVKHVHRHPPGKQSWVPQFIIKWNEQWCVAKMLRISFDLSGIVFAELNEVLICFL